MPSVTDTGLVSNIWQAGCALLWLPFYLLAKLSALAGMTPVRDDPASLLLFFTNFGSALYAALGLLLAWDSLLLLGLGGRRTLAAALAAIGTPYFYYMTVGTGMSHGPSAFAITLYLWLVLKCGKEDLRSGWLRLGVLAGILVMLRPQNALYVPFALVRFIGRGRPLRAEEGLAAAARGAAGFLLGFGAQMLVWHKVYGGLLAFPLRFNVAGGGFHLGDVLFSPFHGLLFWTPLTLLSLLGYALAWRRLRGEPAALGLGLALLLQFLPVVFHACWWGGLSFGIRFLSDALLPVCAGVAFLMDAPRAAWARRAALGACLLSAAWTLCLFLAALGGDISLLEPEPVSKVLLAPLRLAGEPGNLFSLLTVSGLPTMKLLPLFALILAGAFALTFDAMERGGAACLRRAGLFLVPLSAVFLALTARAYLRTHPRFPSAEGLFSHRDLVEYYAIDYRQTRGRIMAQYGRPEDAQRFFDETYRRFQGNRAMEEYLRRAAIHAR